jgi:hypothetical protein
MNNYKWNNMEQKWTKGFSEKKCKLLGPETNHAELRMSPAAPADQTAKKIQQNTEQKQKRNLYCR